MKQLDIFANHVLVGHLREGATGQLTFGYAPQWLAHASARALTPDLPLGTLEYSSAAVLDYFDNLLPEGNVRDFIAQAAHISDANVFGLLERFGGDTAGELSLLPQGQTPSPEPHYLPVTPQLIQQWFANSRGIPLRLAGEQARMSLSGAQDKVAVLIKPDGSMAIPLGAAPSSHIIKPSMGHQSHIAQTAVNEALVMRLAAAVGLDVPAAWYDPKLDAVIIQRYDRALDSNGQIYRLQQNDLCQLMGLNARQKYEAEGGPSLKTCFTAVIKHSSQPALDKKRLLQWLVFNLAVGNMDSHAKNLSMLEFDKRNKLAPLYDLICTTVYPNLSSRFAFKIGGENRPGWIMDRHWQRFADEVQIKPQLIKKIRLDMVERIESALSPVANALRESVSHQEGLAMLDRVQAEIRRSTGRLRERANTHQAADQHNKQPASAAASVLAKDRN